MYAHSKTRYDYNNNDNDKWTHIYTDTVRYLCKYNQPYT